MGLTSYPEMEQAIEAATIAAPIIRNGTYIENKDILGKAVWNVQGYVQKVVLGELPQAAEMPAEFYDLAVAIEPIIEGEADEPQATVPWPLIVMILKLIYDYIRNR